MIMADFQISSSSSLKEQIKHASEDDSEYQDKSTMLTADRIISKAENSNLEMKTFDINMERLLVKHTPHALLHVPEHRPILATSENSMVSCTPPMSSIENVLHIDTIKSASSVLRPSFIDDHKGSVQIGAPIIDFTDQNLCHKYSSQSTFVLKSDTMKSEPVIESSSLYRIKNNTETVSGETIAQSKLTQQAILKSNISEEPLPQCVTKRVRWLPIKNLQENELYIGTTVINKRNRRQSMFDLRNETFSRNGFQINKQFDSMFHLDHASLLNKKTDTPPPLDTLDWSDAGSSSPLFFLRHFSSTSK
ncbi:unnamed protein product [Onchocerca flexuosa]|uniref:Uncharacterized protein n=1 Tax=Onchocerca flexuosa TaxID=387005 RepID=A0A183H009_9BILA|nr:unnamed protein product [Onchocerca flexuosa]